ncbi:hypothetical protein [Pseudomonas proteolytica]
MSLIKLRASPWLKTAAALLKKSEADLFTFAKHLLAATYEPSV